MRIILGPASAQLGQRIAEHLKTDSVNVAFKTFPDGENYVRLESSAQDDEVASV